MVVGPSGRWRGVVPCQLCTGKTPVCAFRGMGVEDSWLCSEVWAPNSSAVPGMERGLHPLCLLLFGALDCMGRGTEHVTQTFNPVLEPLLVSPLGPQRRADQDCKNMVLQNTAALRPPIHH